ncbi:N-acetylmuramoyl-L-alanine amidase [Listeria monocytogenes]|uniref:N-acetylmuramoyl-L-alanine amidase n=1 Tax=Listeria monocytogenes TaxID=1639 RepID=UPI0010E2F0C1|nr:N-acetylmuramoyl-L-alanine amidase [Listeria monocytogenes]EAC8432196.1 N-acetylmuramoyl-L-alanine amidase [Listeria monocytogenes]
MYTYYNVTSNAGHSHKVEGAFGNGYKEHVEALKYNNEFIAEVKAAGAKAFNTTSEAGTQSAVLVEQAKKANAVNKAGRLDVSWHFNSAANKSATGVEVLYYDNAQKQLATDVSAVLAKTLGLRDRGAKQRKDLYFLANTNAPAILIEVAFISNATDMKAATTKRKAAVKAVTKVVTGKEAAAKNTNPNRHSGAIVDSIPALPKADFKTTPVQMYKAGTSILVYDHNKYWYKTYIHDKLCFIYKDFCVNNGKKDVKGRIPVKIKSKDALRIPVWDNTRLNSGKIKWYKPGTRLSWYDNKKGFLELWYTEDGWYYTANYFLK